MSVELAIKLSDLPRGVAVVFGNFDQWKFSVGSAGSEFDNRITEAPSVTRRIPESGEEQFYGVTLTNFSDFRIDNSDGEYTSLIFTTSAIGSPAKIYYFLQNANTDNPDEMLLVAEGLVGDIEKSGSEIVISIVDKTYNNLEDIRTEATASNVLYPMVFGKVRLMEALLTDPLTLEYTLSHNNTPEGDDSVIDWNETRDRGAVLTEPAQVTRFAASGNFVLNQNPDGPIMVTDLEGIVDNVNVYPGPIADKHFSVGAIAYVLIKHYLGLTGPEFWGGPHSSGDDPEFWYDFLPTWQCGFALMPKDSVRPVGEMLLELMRSGGCFLNVRPDGMWQIGQIQEPTAGSGDVVIDFDKDVVGDFDVERASPAYAKIRLGYNQRWGVMREGEIATSALGDSDLLTQEFDWLEVNSLVGSHSGGIGTKEIRTLLYGSTAANAAIDYFETIYKQPRYLITFTARGVGNYYELGHTIELENSPLPASIVGNPVIVATTELPMEGLTQITAWI